MFFKNKMSAAAKPEGVESPTITVINNTIKNIGYIALCISILLFLIIKILKYLLARRKFKFKITNSTQTTPNSLTPILKRSFTP